MAVKIKFDQQYNPQQPSVILATRNFKKIGLITNISGFHVKDNLNAPMEISFAVHKSYDADPINREYSDGGIIVAGYRNEELQLDDMANIETFDSDDSEDGFNIYARTEDELIERHYDIWDEIKNFRKVWIKEWDLWCTLTYDVEESNETVKHVTLTPNSEFELSNNNVHNLEINTESDILRENYKEPTVFFDPFKPESSLLDRLLTFVRGFTVAHVDDSLRSIQRTFSLDGSSVYDAFSTIAEEIECLFVFGSSTNLNGTVERSISAYDLRSYCYDCGKRSDYDDRCSNCGSTNIKPPYGEDTTIFIDTYGLAETINLTTDTDAVKNCFRLVSGDGLMDSAIIASNPNGTQYMWYFTDVMKEDMSRALKDKLDAYDREYDYYQNKYVINANSSDVSMYNYLINKYRNYNPDLSETGSIVGYAKLMNVLYDVLDFELYLESGLMPTIEMDTTAVIQANRIFSANVPNVAVQNLEHISKQSADNAVLSVIKTIVDPRYNVKMENNSTLDTVSKTWTGSFIVTSMTNDEDTAKSDIITIYLNGDYETFIKQKIEKTISQNDKTNYSIGSIFKMNLEDFKFQLRRYSLAGLNSFLNAGNAALGVMVELGLSSPTTAVLIEGGVIAYQNIYVPYYNKVRAIETEMALRESEISVIETMRQMLISHKEHINDILNIDNYLGKDLVVELYSYRMEDDYENSNYISDGLDNATLFKLADEFVEVASREIRKAAIEHHSISTTLNNLLTIKEFEPLVDYFSVGNWLRAKIDGTVYKLKLLSYEIDFDNIESLNVEFSDAVGDIDTSISDILSQARSMTKSYGSVKKQAQNGTTSKQFIDSIASKGLDLTTSRIINTATNQTQQWDENGILLREYDDITDSYSNVQMKIINSTLAVTKDNWETTETAVGRFYYPAPKTGEITEGYGVIARTIIGEIILGQNVSVYNSNSSIEIDENGIVVTTNGDDQKKSAAITVQKQYTDHNGNSVLTKQMYIDEDGNLVVKGDSIKFDVGKSFAEKMAEVSNSLIARKELNVALSNEYHCIPLTANGTYDYMACFTNVYVYYGFDDVTSNATVNITPSDGVYGTWDNTTYRYIINNMTTDSGTVTFNVAYNGNVAQKVMNIIRGTEVSDGVFTLAFNNIVIKRNTDGSLTPSLIAVTALKHYGGTSYNYNGNFVISESIDGSYWEDKYISMNDEATVEYTPSTSNINYLQFKLYKSYNSVQDAWDYAELYINQNYKNITQHLYGTKIYDGVNEWYFTYDDDENNNHTENVVFDIDTGILYINNIQVYQVFFSRSDDNLCDIQTLFVISDVANIVVGSRNLIRNSDTLIYEVKILNPDYDETDQTEKYILVRQYDFV